VDRPTVVFVPGLRDEMPGHWQSLLHSRLPGSACVPRLGKDNLCLGVWVDAIDHTVRTVPGPVILVAHSAGVVMTAHWARGLCRNVQGALLVAPPDFEAELPAGYPSSKALEQNGWMPVPYAPMPFRSVVVGSSNDSLCSIDRARSFAAAWGSEWVDAGAVGHLNPASGHGEWPQAAQLLERFGVELPARPAPA
jgi:uncharacterized protein